MPQGPYDGKCTTSNLSRLTIPVNDKGGQVCNNPMHEREVTSSNGIALALVIEGGCSYLLVINPAPQYSFV